jgi:hypothetical protein
MTPDRLRTLLDAYGARAERWPAGEREAAEALLAQSAEARRWREEAARLDVALDRAPVATTSADLAGRILAALPAHRVPRRPRAWRWLAAGASLAAAAALALSLRGTGVPEPQPTRLATSDLDAYATPTDVWLVTPGLEMLETTPAFGCAGAGLGCPDLDATRGEQSRLPGRVYT